MATTTTSVDVTTQLVSTTSLTYIRPLQLRITATLLKPNTRMYAFFDGVDVNQFCTPNGGVLGDSLVTDSNGNLIALFNIPAMTFTTGNKQLVLIDYSDYTVADTPGISVVKAKAIFSSQGTLQTYQTTETTTITTTVEDPPPNYDPLAQSFFTYGITGGCYITSIDLFFLTKDDTLPVWVELREMVAGYPGPKLVDNAAKAIVNAADVNVSSAGTTATNFKFGKMVYLKQDTDYCFVVRSNSNRYNLFTSKLGEVSLETGKVVFDQPYMGSLFRSENNITWSAEQTEDIKFVLKRADFTTGTNATLNLSLRPKSVAMTSTSFQTVLGTSKILVSFPFQHGLRVDSKIALSVDNNGTYNGIAGSLLNDTFSVTDLVNEYTVAFYVPSASATSTGEITTGGLIKEIVVDNGGSGYSSTNLPVISFTGAGSNATATPIIKNGAIASIVITNPGTGYTGDVTVDITSTIGSGASATAYTTPQFTVTTNRVYHTLKPQFDYTLPQGTAITASIDTTTAYFDNGGLSHYGSGKTYDVSLDNLNYFDSNLLVASRFNEIDMMGSNRSAALNVTFSTDNSNVSPVIDLTNSSVTLRTNSINNQKEEVISSTNSSGSVLTGSSGITIVSGGTGYASAPTVVISGTGTGAEATCTISGGVVNSVTVTNGGSGYYGTAHVFFEGGGFSSRATGTVTLSDYNSELKSNYGNALSRYVTKKQTLQSVSYGIRVYATAFSNANSSFEVYVKTSLSSSGVNHDAQEWKLLTCDIERNKSKDSSQFLEYEFYLDNVAQFDVYSLKFVLRTMTPWQPPVINNYRTVVLA